jgi:hypothetical protein
MEVDRSARLHNQLRLRQLVAGHGASLDVFCAHDAAELKAREEPVIGVRSHLASGTGVQAEEPFPSSQEGNVVPLHSGDRR